MLKIIYPVIQIIKIIHFIWVLKMTYPSQTDNENHLFTLSFNKMTYPYTENKLSVLSVY